MKKSIFIIIIFLVLNINTVSEENNNIAVLDFSPRNLDSDSAKTVADIVRSELNKTKKFQILDRNIMDKILEEHALQSSGITDIENAVKAGKILNVKLMAYGSFSKLGNAYIISMQVIDIETGKIKYSENEKFFKIEDSDIAVKRIVQKITDQKIKGAEQEYEKPITGKPKIDKILNDLKRKYGTSRSKRYKIEIIGYLYDYDDIMEDYYAFILFKKIDIPTKEVEIVARAYNMIGTTFKPPHTTKAAKKAFEAGKKWELQAKIFSPSKGDTRKIEYRVYQKNGKPTAIEIYLVTRNEDWTPKKPKSLKYNLK